MYFPVNVFYQYAFKIKRVGRSLEKRSTPRIGVNLIFNFIFICIINILLNVLFNIRFNPGDEEFIELINMTDQIISRFFSITQLLG